MSAENIVDFPSGTVAQGRDKRAEDRDATIKAIRDALKKRSGKPWSVTGGRGTAWGWIKIQAPPARCTFAHRTREGMEHAQLWRDRVEEYDTGTPGRCQSFAEIDELARLLDIPPAQCDPASIPASYDYRQEYIDRAEGRKPRVLGEPYWD